MVFSRFAWRVQPRNYLLLACHLTNATAQMVQGSRFLVRAESAQKSMAHLSPTSATPELPLHGREREAAERASKDAYHPGRFCVGLLASDGGSCASMQWQCNVNALLYYNVQTEAQRSLRLGLHAIIILCAQVDKILCISASFLAPAPTSCRGRQWPIRRRRDACAGQPASHALAGTGLERHIDCHAPHTTHAS